MTINILHSTKRTTMNLSSALAELGKELEDAIKLAETASFNILTLSQRSPELEEYHSDIIAKLLSPDGKHGEGNSLLFLFLDFLNQHHDLAIDKSLYKNAQVIRESDVRIDISIRGEGHAIIIENKINNADDRDGQLDDYYGRLVNQGVVVDAILYITRNGAKNAPMPTDSNAAAILRNLSGFENAENDLATGWLAECEQKGVNVDTKSFCNQYAKLLKSLSSSAFEKQAITKFLKYPCSLDFKDIPSSCNELRNSIMRCRLDSAVTEIKDYRPFMKSKRGAYVQSFFQMYFEFIVEGCEFQLDLNFMADGSCGLLVYSRPWRNGKMPQNATMKMLSSAGVLDEFETSVNPDQFKKLFPCSSFDSLYELDQRFVKYTKEIMNKLRSYAKP